MWREKEGKSGRTGKGGRQKIGRKEGKKGREGRGGKGGKRRDGDERGTGNVKKGREKGKLTIPITVCFWCR